MLSAKSQSAIPSKITFLPIKSTAKCKTGIVSGVSCKDEHGSPVSASLLRSADMIIPTALRAAFSEREGFLPLSPLIEEMPDRAEESTRANHVHPYETNKKAPPGNQISRQCRNISAVIFPQTRCFSAAALPHRSPPAKRTRRRCLRPDRCRPPAHAAAPCHRSPASAAW